jgi:hypothetical protein
MEISLIRGHFPSHDVISRVMPALVAGIHAFLAAFQRRKA